MLNVMSSKTLELIASSKSESRLNLEVNLTPIIQEQSVATSVNFQLPENLTIASVQGLHEQLEALVDQPDHDKVCVKADSVARADTAGVQLLLAFTQSLKERQIEWFWDAPSEKLVSAATVLGLDEALGLH